MADQNIIVRVTGETDLNEAQLQLREMTNRSKELEAQMRNLAKAEAEDRLLILPCKVGDTVYLIKQVMIGTKSIFDARVNGISVSYAGDVILHFGGHPPVSYCASSIGETIFLTRAEAEAALRKEADG